MHTDDSYPSWLSGRSLPQAVSLQVLDATGTVLFSSAGKWLHPLLDAERFIEEQHLDASGLYLHDRVAGRAAACLAVRMGFKAVRLCMMSRLAEQVYRRYRVGYEADQTVDRIACRTEDLIDDAMDLDAVHRLIHRRATEALKNVR